MAESFSMQMYLINKWTYRYYSKKEPVKPSQKIAWITSFVPVELLETLDISYVYPESYAAVIAASGKAQDCLRQSSADGLSLDCCSYSACFNGCLSLGKGPRGIPPLPDILIASSNQCNTLPNWWNLLAEQLDVPLIVLDYPGETNAGKNSFEYVCKQHLELVKQLEELSGNKLNEKKLLENIKISRGNVEIWQKILALFYELDISAQTLFDYISPLVTARCRPESTDLLKLIVEQLSTCTQRGDDKRVYWVGYPFWYDAQRHLQVQGTQIIGSNYATWWNLNYDGGSVWEMLYNAYNFTVLNLSYESRARLISKDLLLTQAEAVVINRNKSCKRDLSSLSEFDCDLPCVIIESDMIDGTFLDVQAAKDRIDLLLVSL